MARGRGWHNESARHAAAARGIPTVEAEEERERLERLEEIRWEMDDLVREAYDILKSDFPGHAKVVPAAWSRHLLPVMARDYWLEHTRADLEEG